MIYPAIGQDKAALIRAGDDIVCKYNLSRIGFIFDAKYSNSNVLICRFLPVLKWIWMPAISGITLGMLLNVTRLMLGAICRKLLARVFVILKEQRPYVIRDF